MKRVIVIGSGVGGLSAAIELATRGFSVTVLEADDRPGGKAGRELVDGVEFDTGPSVLTMPEVFERTFEAAGTRLAEHVELLKPEPAFRYLYPDGTTLHVHHGREETLESITHTLGPKAGRELADFLAYAEQIWSAAAPNFVFAERPSWTAMLRLGLRRTTAVMNIDAMRTMWRSIEARVSSPHLRSLLARYATYNGSDVHRAPATLNCIAHVELGLGGFGVRGGLYRLVEAMVGLARASGVELALNTRVARLIFAGGRTSGVALADGAQLAADAIVCNADVGHLVEALIPSQIAHELRAPSPPSMSGLTSVWAARPLMPSRAAHTVVFPGDYEREFRDIFEESRDPVDPAIYLCAQDVAHARSGWSDGRAPLFVMTNAPAEPRGGRAADESETRRAKIEAGLRARGLLSDGDEVVWGRSPRDLALRYPNSRGALYGAASNGALAAFRRAPNRVRTLPGLYLASGSAHPGGGLPLCAASGRWAAKSLCEDSGVDFDHREEPRGTALVGSG